MHHSAYSVVEPCTLSWLLHKLKMSGTLLSCPLCLCFHLLLYCLQVTG